MEKMRLGKKVEVNVTVRENATGVKELHIQVNKSDSEAVEFLKNSDIPKIGDPPFPIANATAPQKPGGNIYLEEDNDCITVVIEVYGV